MPTRYEYYHPALGDNALQIGLSSRDWAAQSFTPDTSHTITHVALKMWKNYSNIGNVVVSIRLTDVNGRPKDADLASATIASSGIYWSPTSGGGSGLREGVGLTVALDVPLAVTAGTQYSIVIYAAGATASRNIWWRKTASSVYAGGILCYSTNGVNWSSSVGDAAFEEWDGEPSKPTVTTQDATSIITSIATANGNVTALGDSEVYQHGVVRSGSEITDPLLELGYNEFVLLGAKATVGTFTYGFTGLTPGTTYHYKAYAISMAGISYGVDVSFVAGEVVFPTDPLARVSSIRHIFRPGSFRMQVQLGDLGFDIDVAEALVRKEVARELGEAGAPRCPVGTFLAWSAERGYFCATPEEIIEMQGEL